MGYWTQEGHYKYPESYETDDIKITRIVEIDPKKPYQCPRCEGSLARDGTDAHCWVCGYFNFFYFDIKVLKFIKWVERREKRYGAPILLSDREAREIAYPEQYRMSHKEEMRAIQSQWYINNRERILAHQTQYYADNKERVKASVRQYRIDHREEILEKDRNRKRRTHNIPVAVGA